MNVPLPGARARRAPPPLLSIGFRPFFLLAGLAAAVLIAAWIARLHGAAWPGAPADAVGWHAHEMLFGFVGAAVAGFMLTAVPSFTGRPPLTGAPLALLALVWIAARLAQAFAGALPPGLAAIPDVGFLALLAAVVARDVAAAGNRRNLVLVAVLLALAAADGADHLRAGPPGGAPVSAGIHLVLLLVALLGGRIIPSFTTNWLRARGAHALPVSVGWNEAGAIAATVVVGALDAAGAPATIVGGTAIAAAVLHGLRLARWRGLATRAEPLLLVLHAGYAWLVAGYALLALADLAHALPRGAALHALTAGAMGTMILAMMSRVALGHTGRALRAPRPVIVAYVLVGAAAALRVAAPLVPSHYAILVAAAGLAWIAAFATFVAVYAPILVGPRAGAKGGDG